MQTQGVLDTPHTRHSRDPKGGVSQSGNLDRSISKIETGFSNEKEMHLFFSQLNNQAPPPRERRYEERQIAKEIFCIERYLVILAKNQRLEFPITLTQKESPDFEVCINGIKAGIEITEATEEDYQKWLVKYDDPALFNTDNPNLSDALSFNQCGYAGYEQQQVLCDQIINCITEKNKKLNKYKENIPDCQDWRLLICEDIWAGNQFKGDREYVHNRLERTLPSIQHQFSEISILTGKHLLIFP